MQYLTKRADCIISRIFDLLYRLNALQVTLPPLRDREDFLEIVRFLMDRIAPGVAITDAAIESLPQRPWPGNFRELRTTLQRLVIQYLNEEDKAKSKTQQYKIYADTPIAFATASQ